MPPSLPATPEGDAAPLAEAAEEGRPPPWTATGETLDWVSAAAWADVPVTEEEAAEEVEAEGPGPGAGEGTEGDEEGTADAADRGEATTAPRVPAALPMRRRRRPQVPIRTRGSGEWYYSDPPERQPLVRRRFALAPPVALGVLGLMVVALVVFLLPALLDGGRGPGPLGAAAESASPATAPRATPAPRPTPAVAPTGPAETPEASPTTRRYRVRSGDTLSGIAARFGVRLQLIQCRNLLRDPNRLSPGQVLFIPPRGYTCPPGWRRATGTPAPEGSPEATGDGPLVEG